MKKYPVKCLDYGDSLHCDANVTTIAHMFNLKLSHHQTLSGKIYLPYELQDKILFVEGLINKKKIRHLPNFRAFSIFIILDYDTLDSLQP